MKLLALAVFLISPAFSANRYIRVGAGGANNGTDWTNAFTAPPSTLVRGDTYYIAAGTYGEWTITIHTASGSIYTNFLRATVAAHGTSTGWSDSYASGQVVLGNVSYNASGTGYLLVDGVDTTCGALYTGTQACGIKITNTTHNDQAWNFDAGGTNTIVQYVEIQGPAGTSTADFAYTADAQGFSSWGGGASNAKLRHSYVHGSATLVSISDTGFIAEYNLLRDSRSNCGCAHSNVAFIGFSASNQIYRYNKIYNYNDEGFFITWYTGTPHPHDLKFYGNIHWSPGTTNPRGVELRQDNGNYEDIEIYNNTYAQLSGGGIKDRSSEAGGGCTNCKATNNLSYQAGNSFLDVVSSNNTDDSTNRFTNLGTVWSLTAALAGASLATEFNTDMLGGARGGDAVWDRGAIEYVSGSSPPTVTTTAASSVTATTAASGGNVTSGGSTSVTARGVCRSLSTNPTTADTCTSDGIGTGSFTSSLTGMSASTLYHIRAFATNSIGTSYGSDLTFTTSAASTPPTVSTTAASSVTTTTASSGGDVTNSGSASVTARGVCRSTSANPTTAATCTSNGTGTGAFTSSLTGMSANTLYHIRAFATNSVGTSYGSDLTVTTAAAASRNLSGSIRTSGATR